MEKPSRSPAVLDSVCIKSPPIVRLFGSDYKNLSYYINLYSKWAGYEAEEDGILIAYTSVYGNTKAAAEYLYEKLKENGVKTVVSTDLARSDMSLATADAFKYSKLVLATTTYNADIFPFMREFINHLTERNFQNRKVSFIENGSWAPMATKVMKAMLEKSKNLTFAETEVKILSSMTEENRRELEKLASELI